MVSAARKTLTKYNVTKMDNYVITIGRQFGSGGRELGRLLAEKLNIPFYDKELLYKAAADAGLNPEFFEAADERVPQFINGIFSFNFGASPLTWYTGSSAISDDNLYKAQSDFIHKIAAAGPCVIVGRSSDYILRDVPNVVNVFLHAHIDDCAARIVQRSDTKDVAAARKLANKVNRLRANYYNFYTDKKWGDASSYDLCFNTSVMPMDDIAEVVVNYLNRRLGE